MEGVLDLESSKKLLLEIASATAPFGDFEILLDTRKTQNEMSAVDLWCLAEELSKFRLTFFRKIAILCPVDRFDKTAFFALAAQNRGYRVGAFDSFEAAIEWLTLKDDDQPTS